VFALVVVGWEGDNHGGTGHHLGVLHYDHDYDVIADRTDLRFASVWLADPGTL
jgi:hypothetical protein